MKRIGIIGLVAVLGALPPSARATLLPFDFEDLSGGADSALVSKGFVFDGGLVDWYPGWTRESGGWVGHYHVAGPGDTAADNGTKFLVVDYYIDNSILNIYEQSGQVFGVRSFDLAETFGLCGPHTPPGFVERHCGVTYVGQLAGGGTITQHVILDGIADGSGPLVDFQTFTFDEQWDALSVFSIVASHPYLGTGLDNLVLRTVSEPTSFALLGTGILSVLSLRKRRTRLTQIGCPSAAE